MEVSTPVPSPNDMLNELAGLAPASPIAAVRALRPDVVRHSQGSYEKLLAPPAATGLTLIERALVALRVAVLTDSPTLMQHYRQRLADLGVAPATLAAIAQPDNIMADNMMALDQRSAAIMRHVDLLTRAPGQATPEDLYKLQASGLSSPEIVTLSQLIAFLSFQVRVLPVLSLLAEGEAA